MARFGRIAFIYFMQFFPEAQTLVGQHLHKARQTPVIIYQTVANLPLAFLLEGLLLLLFDDHLPLGKIADHHSPFSQSVCDQMGGFVQTVLLLAPLFLGDTFVDPREVEIAARFLLTLVPFGTNLVQLFVIPAIALEAAEVIETTFVSIASSQCLDTQIKGHDALIAEGTRLLTLLAPLACLAL